jgi:hypothetical protein
VTCVYACARQGQRWCRRRPRHVIASTTVPVRPPGASGERRQEASHAMRRHNIITEKRLSVPLTFRYRVMRRHDGKLALLDSGPSPRAGILSAKALSHSLKPSPRESSRRKSHVDAPPVKWPSPRASLDPLGEDAPRGVLSSHRRPSYRHGTSLR